MCLLLASAGLWAQEAKAVMVASDEYTNMAYMAFADDVKMDASVDHVTAARLGRSYMLNGKPGAAAYWYEKAVGGSESPENILRYAQALLADGQCEKAINWYQKYRGSIGTGEGARGFIKNCAELETAMVFGHVDVEPAKGINSEHLDFSPIPVDGGMVFTSSRESFSPFRHRDMWTKDFFTNLYWVERNSDGSFGESRPLFNKVNKKYHDGAAVFTTSENKMYFSRNNRKGKNTQDIIDLKIYEATKSGDTWSDAGELPFNSDEFSTCHPTLTSGGQAMVFASNRPGGFGGMDLWVSKKMGATWSEPVNLGDKINSADNEIFPYLDQEGRLFFSSNGWAGLGGLDLFMAESGGTNTWSAPTNLGKGMNSKMDDFGIWVDPAGESGYFSSNREGGMGGDDIYTWKAGEAPVVPAESGVIVVDAETGDAIPGAAVKWAEVTTASNIVLNENDEMTPSNGMLNFTVFDGRNYAFNVTKNGYEPKMVSTPVAALKNADGMYEIPMTRIAMMNMNGIVVDAGTNSKISSADVTLTNLCDNSTAVYRSDASGGFSFDAKCGCDFKMVAMKGGYNVGEKTFKSDCAKKEVSIALGTPALAPSRVVRTTSSAVGQVINLRDVYYDYDKWFIRPSAGRELNKVVEMMNRYPSMSIELGSHTDARGNDEYNRNLSQRRADSAVNYIVSKGISRSRVSARGYGETQLKNYCTNGVNCSDREHQDNRRTEIRITAIEPGVHVDHDRSYYD